MKLEKHWIVGFVDGEGCFSVSLIKQNSMKYGFQVVHEFVVVQHKRDIEILIALQDYFKCGIVAVNHGDRYHFRVRSFIDLKTIIIPFFNKYPLLSKKNYEFERFKKVIEIVERKDHLKPSGLKEIFDILNTMNNRKKLLEKRKKLKIESSSEIETLFPL